MSLASTSSSSSPGPEDSASSQPKLPPEPVEARSSMHGRYGRLLRAVFHWVFGPISYPESHANNLKALAQKGTLVYVSRQRSALLALYFNYALARLGLPLAQFVGGINLLLWQPVDRLWKLWQQRHRQIEGPFRQRFDRTPTRSEALLADMALRGSSAFLALPPHRGSEGQALRHDYVRALVAAQRLGAPPVYLVPHVVVHRAQTPANPHGRPRPLVSRGTLKPLVAILSPAQTRVRVGEPLDLAAFCAQHPSLEDADVASKVRHELHQRMAGEERVVTGPPPVEHDAVARRVLRDPRILAAIEAQSGTTGAKPATLERVARKMLREIAARYTVWAIRFLDVVLHWVFNRIYDGIVVDEAGLARVLDMAGKAPVVFCPSHKSHVDYLVLSYVLWHKGITPPHIAAGVNLSFFPAGYIFRRSGAFFMRRSFRDDPLYKAVFESYVEELLRAGTSIEFFLEGTRSRTGKLLMPKLGLLGMTVEAFRRGAREDLLIVPVSVDYERIVEASSYQAELAGGEKQREDIGALLRTTRVLRSRYGRVHVQFGAPISVKELMATRRVTAESDEAAWRREVQRLGYRVMYEVGRVCSVTPTAVAATTLLGHRGRGLGQAALLSLADGIVDFLYTEGARLSASLHREDTRGATVLEAVHKLVEEGTVLVDRSGRSDAEPIYRVPDERRIVLDFQKNAVMNHFAPAAIVARCLRASGEPPTYEALRTDTRFLSKLLKRELLYRVDADFGTHFDDTLAMLAVRGYLDVHDDGRVVVREPRQVELLAGLLDGFVEGYFTVLQTLTELRAFPLWDKEVALRAMDRARRGFLEGSLRRPESANRTVLETAVAWAVAEGVVQANRRGRRQTLVLADDDTLNALLARVEPFLDV